MLSVNPDARRGPRKTLTGVPCKTGIAWSFDAANGEFLWAKPTVEQNLVARIDPKGLVTVNEDVVLKEVDKTYHICPTYNGGRDWPQGAYNPRSNVMFMPLSNLCIDSTARTDRDACAAVRLQHDQRRQVRGRQGQGRPHRRDLGRDRQDAVELGDARGELLADPGDRRRAPVQRLDGPLPAGARCRQRASRCGRRGFPRKSVGGAVTYSVNGRQYIAIAAGGGPIAAHRRGHDARGGHGQRQQRHVRLRAAAIGVQQLWLPPSGGRGSIFRLKPEATVTAMTARPATIGIGITLIVALARAAGIPVQDPPLGSHCNCAGGICPLDANGRRCSCGCARTADAQPLQQSARCSTRRAVTEWPDPIPVVIST